MQRMQRGLLQCALVAGLLSAAPLLAAPQSDEKAPPAKPPAAEQAENRSVEIQCEDELEFLRLRDEEAVSRVLNQRPSERVDHPTVRVALDDSAIIRILEVAHEIDPVLGTRLQALHEQNPDDFKRAMAASGRRLVGMAELKLRDPKLYNFKVRELQVDKRVKDLAQRVREARRLNHANARSLENELRREVQIQVALKMRTKVESLERLKQHIAALEEEIEYEAMHFLETVEDRMNDLTADGPQVAATGSPAAPSRTAK